MYILVKHLFRNAADTISEVTNNIINRSILLTDYWLVKDERCDFLKTFFIVVMSIVIPKNKDLDDQSSNFDRLLFEKID